MCRSKKITTILSLQNELWNFLGVGLNIGISKEVEFDKNPCCINTWIHGLSWLGSRWRIWSLTHDSQEITQD